MQKRLWFSTPIRTGSISRSSFGSKWSTETVAIGWSLLFSFGLFVNMKIGAGFWSRVSSALEMFSGRHTVQIHFLTYLTGTLFYWLRVSLSANCPVGLRSSGRFVKQEHWERWRAKRKLVSGSNHGDVSVEVRGYKRGYCICEILQSSAFLAGKWFAMQS